jgi:FdrA protein
MGPDCGTGIIQGVPLCFANNIRQGGIGIVGASGTGTQEVSCIIDDLGAGITHAIGVGGRDLSEAVGGIMTLQAIKLLAEDPQTKVIAVISKPPSPTVVAKVLAAVKASGKPSVLIFMGQKNMEVSNGVLLAATLEEGAAKAVALLQGGDAANTKTAFPRTTIHAETFSSTQNKICGLYTGGTLASEAKFILEENGIKNYSIIDLGDDEYTRGALHPMIDPQQRNRKVSEALKDPATAVVLCDVVLGYGSHANPAGELALAVKAHAENISYSAVVLASVTGTNADPQNKTEQERILREAGIFVFPSNQAAAEAAAALAKNNEGKNNE